MALPKIDLPLFPITIPSTKQETTFHPFTVKDEKTLLIAQESKNLDQIILAIKQIITNCVTDVDADDLAIFDLDYLLLNIRAKSVNNVIEFKIKDPDTDEVVEMEIEIDDIHLNEDETHTKHVTLDSDKTLIMRYPSINELGKMLAQDDKQASFDAMIKCIDSLVVGDSVHPFKDETMDEIISFANSLSSAHIMGIKKFFDTMPKLRFEKKYKLKDGSEKTFVIEGMETFFI